MEDEPQARFRVEVTPDLVQKIGSLLGLRVAPGRAEEISEELIAGQTPVPEVTATEPAALEARASERITDEAWQDIADDAQAGRTTRILRARMRPGAPRRSPPVARPANGRERDDKGLF